MNTSVTKTSRPETGAVASPIAGPLSSRALFWRPRFLTGSCFIHHLPFAFWLVDVCRPTTLVAVGVGDGQGYFGFCQAIDKLNMAATCHGFGSWGDEDGAVPADIAAHDDANYGDISRLARLGAVAALKRFAPGSVDLLIVDLAEDLGDAELFLDLAGRKMSDRGVMLFHGLDGLDRTPDRQAALARLCGAHPTIRFDDAAGLVLVLTGTAQDERLLGLAALTEGSAEYNAVQTVFRRLGSGLYHEWRSRSDAEAAQQARAAADEIGKALAEIEHKHATLNAAYNERSRQTALAQADLFDLRRERDATLRQAEAIQAELRPALEAAEAAARRSASAEQALQIQLDTRFQELAALTRELERLTAVEMRNAELVAAQEAKAQRLAEVERKLARAEAQIRKLTSSTSWKITAPLRKVVSAVRR